MAEGGGVVTVLAFILALLGVRPRARRLNCGELEARWRATGAIEAVGEWRRC